MTADERMGAFDAVMWGIEDDPVLRSVIVTLLTLDQAPDPELLRARVERLTRMVPHLRQRVIGNPVSLVPPRWETDPAFHLDYHLRWWALPDGRDTLADVLEVVARTAEQDFDRDRPLWEMTVVTGLVDGPAAGTSRAALIVKLHHSITDGVGGMMLAATLFDLARVPDADPGPMPDAPRAHSPLDPLRRLADGVTFEAQEGVGLIGGLLTGGADALRRVTGDPGGSLLRGAAFAQSALRLLAPAPSPLSPLLVGRSLSIECGILEVPLAEITAAIRRRSADVHYTVNDAFLAVVASGLRRYHDAAGIEVTGLRVNMPVNVRTETTTVGGNAWVPARFTLPLAHPDPLACLESVHPVLAAARSEPALPISTHVYRVLATLPRPAATLIAGALMKGTDVAATNVPGPPFPVFVAGAEVLRIVPFAPKGGAAVNVALMTYRGTASLGVNLDSEAVGDPTALVEDLAGALADLVAAR